MALSVSNPTQDILSQNRFFVTDFNAAAVTTGTIVTPFNNVNRSWIQLTTAAGNSLTVENSNNGTAGTAFGSVYITVPINSTGKLFAIGV